jgi:ATP-binding cassette subfamily F protein uup
VLEYIGGYDDWLRQGGKWTQADELPAAVISTPVIEPKKSKPAEIAITKAPSKQKKLSYKFQKEFDELPHKIEVLEKQMANLQGVTTASDFYSQTATVVEQKLQELVKVQQQLDDCFERWAELEDMQQE